VDVDLARWLVSADAEAALAAAAAEVDPSSLAAAGRLRRDFPPEQAAAALTQAGLRRRAVSKFGDLASRLFFTPDGLEQATRGEVAAWRAARYLAAGVTDVVDLGCGLGADALAFAAAGLAVRAVEADPATAVLASANLGLEVTCADAVEVAAPLLAFRAAVFADPARRTSSGRTWRVADFSPPFDFATDLLAGRFGCIKAAPGLPSSMIPDGVGVTWVSHRGDLVETSLWSSGERTAVLLPSGAELPVSGDRALIGEPGRYQIGRAHV
jgi:SAM-dependent methyltransferase